MGKIMTIYDRYFLGVNEKPTTLGRLKVYRFLLTFKWQWSKK